MDINKYIGIPYEVHGRTFEGTDCYGLIWLFYKNELGIELPNFLDYAHDINSFAETVEEKKKSFIPVEGSPELYNIGVFSYRGLPSHIGLCVGENQVLHILRKHHSVCIRMDHPTLKGRLEGWYKYEER